MLSVKVVLKTFRTKGGLLETPLLSMAGKRKLNLSTVETATVINVPSRISKNTSSGEWTLVGLSIF